MNKPILACVLMLVFLASPVIAQVPGDNIAVLPVVPPVDADGDGEPDNPNWFKVGDGYLQRQLEATIGASTLNPDHLLAFFNDYRAVDVVEGDVGLGEGDVNVTATTLKIARLLLPPTVVSGLPTLQLMAPTNAAEAFIGGARSYDGGFTWSGFFLPGAPWDDSAVSQAAPIYGLEAATDPVLACGPCGTFYLVGVSFTRSENSKIFVARYRDTNDLEGGDTIVYEGMTVIESGNNAEHGYFLDKPDIEVDAFRESVFAKGKPGSEQPVDPCAHRVYVTYSTFNGLTKDGKVQTKMNFAVSEDGAQTFETSKISKRFNQNQASAIAIDPRPGLPGESDGGGTIYVFWRHFFDPNAIIATKSTDFGGSWTSPEVITDLTPLVPFDQPTIPTTAPGITPPDEVALNDGFPELAFRSNGFPAATVTAHPNGDGLDATVFVAWQEQLGVDGRPALGGQPGIVMMRSDDEGGSWTGFDPSTGVAGDRQAIDKEPRNEPFDPAILMPAGSELYAWKNERDAGGQVQPRLSFGGGRFMLTYYESRGRIGNYGTENEFLASEPYHSVDYTGGITGYDRVVDFRSTLLDPADGARLSSAQISRYPIRVGADLSDGQDLSDVAPINPPCYPDSGFGSDPICVRQVNRINAPTSAVGTSPFAGDYPDTVPFVQFVPDGSGGWRWAIEPGDVPSRGFHAIWTDNRHLTPPFEAPIGAGAAAKSLPLGLNEWDAYQYYGPPGIGGPCFNPGSRNTDVLTSRIDTTVIVSAPTTFKQLDTDRSFPFSVANKTGDFSFFKIDITSGGDYASLSPISPDQDTYRVEIFPYSSISLTAYVTAPAPEDMPPDTDPTEFVGPIRIDITQLDCPVDGPLTACTPCVGESCATGSVTFNASSDNPPVVNIDGVEEQFGPEISNAFVINWEFENAFVINSETENFLIDNAFVINDGEENAFVINDGEENAFVINAFVINAFVINSSPEDDIEIHDVIDVTWTMTPGTSNTAASYLPLVNIDFAEQFLANGNYAFQLIVDKPSAYGSAPECEEYATNIYQQHVLSNVIQDPGDPNAFVINQSPENAFVINNQVDNAFVINSTFAMAPSDSIAKRARSLSKNGVIDDSATRAAPPSNKARITLRTFQLKSDEEILAAGQPLYKPDPGPDGWLPSSAVAEISCDPEVEDCFTINGPNLIPSSTVVATDENPLTVDRCGELVFDPLSFTVTNDDSREGTKDAVTRGDNQLHGFFLKKVDAETGAVIFNELLRDFPTDKTLAVGASVSNDQPIVLSVPSGVEDGTYTLVFVADHPLQVSEYDETDNTLEFPVVVESSGFNGLAPPLDGTLVFANSGSAVPLVWEYHAPGSEIPIDSGSADPIIFLSGWTTGGVDCSNYNPDGETAPDVVFQTDEDPGASGLRYDALLKTWQYNWQTKWPDGSLNAKDPLPSGCWEVSISSSLTCEDEPDGPFLVQLN